ncbi:MAG: kinase [Thermoprotei archaeon]|nr:MAG: kinase [Thermoprotei archaeon]RLE89167.1 MAG: kinase [Thermoprotei archaeon]
MFRDSLARGKVLRILITGTPGVGKTVISKALAERLGYDYINLAELATQRNLIEGYDEERKSFIVNVNGLNKLLKEELKSRDNFIIDTHLVEAVPLEVIDLVVVLRAHPKLIRERLEKRNYPPIKVRENVEVEVLDYLLINSISRFGESRVFEVDTTGKSVEEVVSEIVEAMDNPKRRKKGFVNWIEQLEREGVLEEYLSA